MNKSRSTRLFDAFTDWSGRLLLGCCAVLALATACPASPTDNQPADGPMATLDSQCVADGECPDDERCVAGLCSIEANTDVLRYGLHINPSNSSPVPAQQLDIESRPLLDAAVQARVIERVEGEITTTDGEPAPGGTLMIDPVDRDASASQQIVRDGVFSLHQLPGRYSLTYIVDDDRWPRLPLGEYEISGAETVLELEIPQFQELRTVSGQLERTALELLDVLAEPVEDAEIVARASDTGHRSQFATTDENGEFVLHLPPGSDDFDVIVRPTRDNQIVPRATFPGEIDGASDSVSLSLGELDLELATLAIDVDTSSQPDLEPDWRDMRVEIQRSVDLGELLITPPIDDGQIDTSVPLGDYEIEIIPPADSPWSSASRQISLTDSILPEVIELPARPRVEGRVTGPDGQSIGGVRVDIVALGNSEVRPEPVYTDLDGRFVTWLNPGDYRVVSRPPVDTGLPQVDRTIEVRDNGAEVDIEIPRGLIATGQLTTDAGDSVAYATVTAVDDDGQRIARSQTDSSGVYRLVLPPSIVDEM